MDRETDTVASSVGCGSACRGGIGVGIRSISPRDELEADSIEGTSVNVEPEVDESGDFCRILAVASSPRQASISSTSPVSDSPSDLVSDSLAIELGRTDFRRTPTAWRRMPSTFSFVD